MVRMLGTGPRSYRFVSVTILAAAAYASGCVGDVGDGDGDPNQPTLTPESEPGETPLMKLSTVQYRNCLLYTSPSPRDQRGSRMPSSA